LNIEAIITEVCNSAQILFANTFYRNCINAIHICQLRPSGDKTVFWPSRKYNKSVLTDNSNLLFYTGDYKMFKLRLNYEDVVSETASGLLLFYRNVRNIMLEKSYYYIRIRPFGTHVSMRHINIIRNSIYEQVSTILKNNFKDIWIGPTSLNESRLRYEIREGMNAETWNNLKKMLLYKKERIGVEVLDGFIIRGLRQSLTHPELNSEPLIYDRIMFDSILVFSGIDPKRSISFNQSIAIVKTDVICKPNALNHGFDCPDF